MAVERTFAIIKPDAVKRGLAGEVLSRIHAAKFQIVAIKSLVASLIQAAQNGKQVTVIIELKARFDEAANIKWARLMREAGVNVIYGIAGLKTHAKAMLIVRQEGEVIRRYAHLGTGNYHPSTARLYTDLGLLTAREDLTSDVASMFNILTGVSKFPGLKELLMAPYDLREGMLALIDREIVQVRIDQCAAVDT